MAQSISRYHNKEALVQSMAVNLHPVIGNRLARICTKGWFSDHDKDLKNIRSWNGEEVAKLRKEALQSCPEIGTLISALYASHINVLLYTNSNPDASIRVPSDERFLHNVLINTARHYINNPKDFVIEQLSNWDLFGKVL